MTRPSYGTVGGRRPSTGAALQWMVIGGLLSFGCSAVMALMLLTFGVLELGSTSDDGGSVTQLATATPFDLQATFAAMLATQDAMNSAGSSGAQSGMGEATSEATSEADIQATIDAGIALALASTQTALPSVERGVVIPSATPPRVVVTPPTTAPISTDAGAGLVSAPTDAIAGTTGLGGIPTTAPTVSSRLQQLVSLASPMVEVAGGTFTMGTTLNEIQVAVTECNDLYGASCNIQYGQDSTPDHQVQLSTFWIDTTEVTYQQYVAFLNYTGAGSHRTGCGSGVQAQACIQTTAENEYSFITFDSQNYEVGEFQQALPAAGVTWYGAQAYCEAIGRRLPTEAEWERAARGPNNYLYPWGNTFNPDYARTSYPTRSAPYEVASVLGNMSGYGLYDMAGNVAEWVADYYFTDYYAQQDALGISTNPAGPANGTSRVIRGGSWDTPPFFSRAVHRQDQPPTEAFLWLGFRCASSTNPGVVETFTQGDTGAAFSTADPNALGPVATAETPDARATLPALPDSSLPNITATPSEVPAVPPGS